MKFSILLVIFIAIFHLTASATPQVILPSFLRQVPGVTLSTTPQAVYYDVNGAALTRTLAASGELEIPNFPGSYSDYVTLDLKPAHSPIDSTTQFWIGAASGTHRIPEPSFAAYSGKVLGEPHSRVFLTTFAGRLLVSITRESGETYVFGPAKNDENPERHVFIRQSDLFSYSELHPFNCIAGDISQPNAPEPVSELLQEYRDRAMNADSLHTQLLQLDVAVEADSCFYHDAGGDTDLVLGYIASLFAMSSTIYENEVNITWHLTWVKLWTSGDPYNVKGNAYGLEDTVPKYWRAHYANVPRDCAHVLTSIGYGGGGFGYYSMCDSNWSYSMSSPQTRHHYPTFAFTYDAYIVAHEIGHNFSLVHSHCCYWDPPLDTCFTKDDTMYGLRIGDACDSLPIHPLPNPGSIMSYCANANYAIHHHSIQYFELRMTFTKKVDSVLRMNAENSACIVPPPQPTLILLSPRGSESYPGDTTVSIRWTYANITTVSLEYSSDGGTFWNPIAASIPSDSGEYAWKIPNIASNRMIVRASAITPIGSIADTSLLFFTVIPVSSVVPSAAALTFVLSPNPVHDMLTLSGGIASERIRYRIVDVAGNIVNRGELMLSGGQGTPIPIFGLRSGTYYLRITSPVVQNFPFAVIK